MDFPKILSPEARLTLLEYCCGTKWVSIDVYRETYYCEFPYTEGIYSVKTTGQSYGEWLFDDDEKKSRLDRELIEAARYLRDDIYCSLKILRTDYDYSLFRTEDGNN